MYFVLLFLIIVYNPLFYTKGAIYWDVKMYQWNVFIRLANKNAERGKFSENIHTKHT